MVTHATRTRKPFLLRTFLVVATALTTGTLGFFHYVWPDLQRRLIVRKLENLNRTERLQLYQETYPIFLAATESRPWGKDCTRIAEEAWGEQVEALSPRRTLACENHFLIQFPRKVGLEVWPDLNDIGPSTGFGVTLAVEGKRSVYMRQVDLDLQMAQ